MSKPTPRNNLDQLRNLPKGNSLNLQPKADTTRPVTSKFKPAKAKVVPEVSSSAQPKAQQGYGTELPLDRPVIHGSNKENVPVGRDSSPHAKQNSPLGTKRTKSDSEFYHEPSKRPRLSGLVDLTEDEPPRAQSLQEQRSRNVEGEPSLSKENLESMQGLETVSTEDLRSWRDNHMQERSSILEKIIACLENRKGDKFVLECFSTTLQKRIDCINEVLYRREKVALAPSAVAVCATLTRTPEHRSIASNDDFATLREGMGMGSSPNAVVAPILEHTSLVRSTVVLEQITLGSNFNNEWEMDHAEEDRLWAEIDAPVNGNHSENADSAHARTPGLSPVGKKTYQSATDSSLAVNRANQTDTPYYQEAIRVLKEVFKLDDFRHNQVEAINSTLAGKDVFVLMPTGGGKSLCYQVPAVCKRASTSGVTIVVSPLVALMFDQVHHLTQKGVDVAVFSSDQTPEQLQRTRSRLLGNGKKPNLLYLTPEKLDMSQDMRNIVQRLHRNKELARFVVDEAHCISTWGRDFRDAYQNLKFLRRDFPGVPIMALTATANEKVMNDVIDQLGINRCVLLTQSFNRSNLHYEVRPKKKGVMEDIAAFIRERQGETGIIYCMSRNRCEEVAKELREKYSIKSRHYHAHMSVDDKSRAQMAWQRGECQVIVATIAFGMGIDKPDGRAHSLFVSNAHILQCDTSFITHYQKLWMDTIKKPVVLAAMGKRPIYTFADAQIYYKMIKDGEKASDEEKKNQIDAVNEVASYCQNEVDCRRAYILRYFGQTFDPAECRKGCNNCLDMRAVQKVELTQAAISLVKLVQSLNQRATRAQCLDIFKGAKARPIREKGFDQNPHFGDGGSVPRAHADRVFDNLLMTEVLKEVCITNTQGWNNMYIEPGPKAQDMVEGRMPLVLEFKCDKAPKRAGEQSTKGKKRRIQRDLFEDDPIEDEGLLQVFDENLEDIGSFPEIRRATEDIHTPLAPDTTGTCLGATNGDVSGHCLKALRDLRDKIAIEEDVDAAAVLDDELLHALSLTLPADMTKFKAEVLDHTQDESEMNRIWKSYGKRLLSVCIGHTISQTTSQVSSSFNGDQLRRMYSYQ